MLGGTEEGEESGTPALEGEDEREGGGTVEGEGSGTPVLGGEDKREEGGTKEGEGADIQVQGGADKGNGGEAKEKNGKLALEGAEEMEGVPAGIYRVFGMLRTARTPRGTWTLGYQRASGQQNRNSRMQH